MKFNVKRDFYTMATVGEESAEIVMYGDIVETQPTSYWTGEPIPGNYIILNEFLADLDQIKSCKNILIRMNSCGGDAGVAITIHNRLRELSRAGTKITCVVDGVAMSGGSLIASAADHVQVYTSSLFMIHMCIAAACGWYNANDLRGLATSNDAYDKAQVSIYSRKTGMDEDEILAMMAETTYLTGREAVEKGFADELLEDKDAPVVAASADRKSLIVHGRNIHLALGMTIPESIPTVTPDAEAIPAPVVNNNLPGETGEGGNDIMTLEELRQEHPELVSEIEASVSHNTAVEAERQRLREIDQIAGLFSDKLVQEAKYGEHPCSAMELSHRAAMAAVKQGTNFLTNLQADANESGTANVGAAPTTEGGDAPKTEEQKMASARASVKAALGKEDK